MKKNELGQKTQKKIESLEKHISKLESKIKKIQQGADRNNYFLRAIEKMHEGLQVIDSNWRYIYLNETAAIQGQNTKSNLVGRTMMECYPDIEKTEMFTVLKKTMKDRKPRRLENKFNFPNGSIGWFELNIEAHSEGLLIRSLDITEKKSLETKYLHAQKMEAIGLLAGGIAHDFNNKLGIMTIYCGMLMELFREENVTAKTYVQRISEAVEQSAALTRQLLAFSRKQVLELKPLNLNQLINNIVDSLEKMLGENINIKIQLHDDLYLAKLDSSQVDQVILNLCVNAKDAMPDGGDLCVETFNQHFDIDYCKSHPEVVPGDYVVLVISDNGVGIDRDVLNHIFEPYYTTKDINKGTGLGLSTVYGIVKQCGGHVWVYSEKDIGTTFKIYFPKFVDEAEELSEIQPEPAVNLRGSETVLLVEDDNMLREALVLALQASGYIVYSAMNVSEAAELFEKHVNNLFLVITDVILNKSNGYKMVQGFKAKNPNLKTLFISGYTENSISNHGILKDNCILLQKPFSIIHFQKVVRQILDHKIHQGVF